MKKMMFRLTLLAVSLLIGFSANNSELKAQCPPGYTFSEIAMTLDKCDYVVQVCTQCLPTGAGKIMLRGWMPQDKKCVAIDDNEVRRLILEKLLSPYYYQLICPNPFPPCETGEFKEFEVYTPLCWKIMKDLDHNNNEVMRLLPCGDAYCVQRKRACRDMQNGGELVWTQDPPYIVGIPECTLPMPIYSSNDPKELTITVIYNNLNVGESSDCYLVQTKCNE